MARLVVFGGGEGGTRTIIILPPSLLSEAGELARVASSSVNHATLAREAQAEAGEEEEEEREASLNGATMAAK